MAENLHKLPPAWFPLVIEALDPVTRRVLWTKRVPLPPDSGPRRLFIPALAKRFGHQVVIRIKFADGTVLE